MLQLEPNESVEEVSYNELFNRSGTLQGLQKLLYRCSRGSRNMENTSIMDVRPFRSKRIRMQSDQDARIADDEIAYGAFEQTMELEGLTLCWSVNARRLGFKTVSRKSFLLQSKKLESAPTSSTVARGDSRESLSSFIRRGTH